MVSVLRCIQGFQRKPLDGGDECAIEGQSPGTGCGGLWIERLCIGHRALNSIQGILKLRNHRLGATCGARHQALYSCRDDTTECDHGCPNHMRWRDIGSLARQRERRDEDHLGVTGALLDLPEGDIPPLELGRLDELLDALHFL